MHLKERMLALEEKNNLSNELAATKKRLEEIGSQKVLIENVSQFYENIIKSAAFNVTLHLS